MGLRTKVTLILIGVLIALSSLTVLVMRWDARRNLELLEATESLGDLRRLLLSLDAQMLQVDAVLGSWANWTSLYEHAGKANPTFVQEELNTEGIRIAHIDWLVRVTPDSAIGDLVEVPQADGTTPVTARLKESTDPLVPYFAKFNDKPAGCGPVPISGQLHFFCYRPLHDTAGGGLARGWVVIGRRVGATIIGSIKEQTDLNFELVPLSPPFALATANDQSAKAPIETLLGHGAPTITRQDERLSISFPITSVRDFHIGDVRMEWPRRSLANARQAMAQTRNTLLMLLLGAAAVLITLIDRLIVRRLRRLKSELGTIVKDHDWNGPISNRGNDEIAELAHYTSGLMEVLRTQLVELRDLSSIDTLTGLPNRRSFDARLAHVMAQYVRAKRPASLILIDIDHFKRYNDTYGHPAGDAALQRVGVCLKSTLRRQLDLAARLGGEEFAVVCDETSLAGAVTCAELVSHAILEIAIAHQGNPPLGIMSISIGVATIEDGDTATSLYQRADQALYAAKESGRNRVSTGT